MKTWRWLWLLAAAFVLAGCTLPGGRETSAATNEPGPPGPPEPTGMQTGGMDLADCPMGGDLYLKFSANFTLAQGEFSMTHVLEDGVLALTLDSAGAIRALEPPQIPYTISGTSGDCTISGQGSMTPDASGDCRDGVVHLIIVENWAQGQATVTCDDESSSATLPSPGAMTHSGADGRGEVFYLDRNFSEEGIGAGSTSIRPFAQGSGEHIWTLYMTDIPTVPLAP